MASQTWFDGLKRSFADVPVGADNSISTTEFLEAAESLTTLFDVLGSKAFYPVKSDLLGNVKKLKDRQLAAPAESETVQSLSVNELKTKKHIASEGLLWLVRGLDFTAQSLRRHVDNTSEKLADSFRGAYGVTLSKHHGWAIKPVFNLAMGAAPDNESFYKSLASSTSVSDEVKAKIQEQLTREVKALENIVSILQKFQEQPDAKW
ncbi:glycolipid transfer protein HET-C2 [Aspergillus nomiae NRRL 13137]|uniref:Glycolipid transfer protein HET-C2 n=1 Tax=Aspergillus nomiae NRRL (strain ATCC 15546 / NRRL 13137 / CBS 260.88 / M93) TaxID=1509407 RepID=A0A0L1J3V9_ASPN3|nr:glycolipid transfer protein HET-C2 [Aspergillus nomiae NRRL 13137]KNG86365.1 glycolipid transfer protein HET-C2 [Aspergillus nomiae NRRL 13137]